MSPLSRSGLFHLCELGQKRNRIGRCNRRHEKQAVQASGLRDLSRLRHDSRAENGSFCELFEKHPSPDELMTQRSRRQSKEFVPDV